MRETKAPNDVWFAGASALRDSIRHRVRFVVTVVRKGDFGPGVTIKVTTCHTHTYYHNLGSTECVYMYLTSHHPSAALPRSPPASGPVHILRHIFFACLFLLARRAGSRYSPLVGVREGRKLEGKGGFGKALFFFFRNAGVGVGLSLPIWHSSEISRIFFRFHQEARQPRGGVLP